MARNYMQGKFNPTNPKKYRGNVSNIVYRSSWERAAFMFCDSTPQIVAWNSEETIIPYRCATDGRMHRYFVDLMVWARQPDGSIKKFIVEIKPQSQVNKPKKTAAKKDETYVNECLTWAKNQSKWKFAKEWAAQNNAEFIIWTENQLMPQGISYNKNKRLMKK
ncbi:hypothetical protein [Ralstonia phage RSP15]|uniref:head closure n=1 Tax=Ralstonia phage RSP15 TaxID=1785960 RepID=UPI00074D3C4F|nr:head closure [Ralstonia phage RSP15]BAU40045.1 hypothetical protein [Ralstonia phage RSP15]